MTSPIRTIPTMCPMNCHPTLCGMLVDVRDGVLQGVRGDRDNPDSQGFLCVRGQASRDIIGNPKRLRKPLIRKRRGEDAWREAGWDEALDLIAGQIAAAGREATALWGCHGNLANGYGPHTGSQMLARFANLYGCQYWSAAMICWGLGGFGLGLTGTIEINTKEDMGANSQLIVLWGANLVSQPNTARHVMAAKRRGARIVTIDVRWTEAAARSDEVLLIRPGSDAALALAMMQVIIAEELYDGDFIAGHTLGFAELSRHVRLFTPEWAARETGIAADRVVAFARAYVTTKPAMIVLGGSSLHKGANSWYGARAVSCLPALVGSYGLAGGGLGPRHGAAAHGAGFASIAAADRRPPGSYVSDQMSEITAALCGGRVRVLLLFGTNMLSSYADSGRVAAALDRLDLVVCHELFMNETTRRLADVVLPGTAWLEDVGCKATHTHLYLMDRILEPEGEARPTQDVLKGLAERLAIDDFYPWASQEELLDAILDHPATGQATIASLRAQGGRRALKVSPVAYPTRRFHTPSGKVEFYSAQAERAGLPPLPVYQARPDALAPDAAGYPLTLCQGRTLMQFHAFYDHGQALPILAERDPGPQLWISPNDAMRRDLAEGDTIRVYNRRGAFAATAHVTERIPPGVVWMRDGCPGLNRVTSGNPALPKEALGLFPFTVGQAEYAAMVEVEAAPSAAATLASG
ncbi:MAG TPA: molybdopterin-dependent oxidoreductase [Stellaceae bacterium]|nr:molybdopterin-dependent oxidoreductase [Stellaceae bacterium]